MHELRTRVCERCGKLILIYPSDIKRGKGMFCCKSCAAYKKKVEKLTKICKACGITFKTTTSSEFCCTECTLICGS